MNCPNRSHGHSIESAREEWKRDRQKELQAIRAEQDAKLSAEQEARDQELLAAKEAGRREVEDRIRAAQEAIEAEAKRKSSELTLSNLSKLEASEIEAAVQQAKESANRQTLLHRIGSDGLYKIEQYCGKSSKALSSDQLKDYYERVYRVPL